MLILSVRDRKMKAGKRDLARHARKVCEKRNVEKVQPAFNARNAFSFLRHGNRLSRCP